MHISPAFAPSGLDQSLHQLVKTRKKQTTVLQKHATHDVFQHPARLQERRDVVRVAGVRNFNHAGRQRGDVRGVARVARAEVDAY